MGPMFPRLHVNDTEKGGPRGPPRNKMALYEQLSIPSKRFKPNSNPPSFSSQGNGHERGMLFPLHLPSSRNSAACSDSTQLTQFESRKKTVGDDSRICIFVNSSADQGLGKLYSKSDWEKVGPASPAYSVCPNKGSKLGIGQNARQHKSPKQPIKAAFSASKRTDVHLEHELREDGVNNVVLLDKSGMNLQTEEQTITINLVRDTEYQKDKGYKSLQTGNVRPGEDSSQTSMVDCISRVDIIPDDIVGLIGKNHFWKARRSIMHQQRLFAFQVFELHRLIKVQKLIAGSPNLLEGSAYLVKSLKGSSAKSVPLEPENVSKHKTDFETPNFRMKFSGENTTRKASFSSVQFSGNPTVAAVSNESDMGRWCFHQPMGQQWLVPVMTPSEGLVYKPYPGPGFTGPVCGGCGSPGVPFAPPAFNGYFPPYAMNPGPAIATSAVEEIKQFSGMGSILHPFIENELQASTASSPSEKSQGVIRAVPRNARSATESAARIFQSIQEERKQYD